MCSPVLNQDCFKSYCLPDTVTEHTKKMKQNNVWGTQAEIFSLSVLLLMILFYLASVCLSNNYNFLRYIAILVESTVV